MTAGLRRENIFVSVCFADFSPTQENADNLSALSACLSARYRYWEILVILLADDAMEDYERLLSKVPNIRLLKVRKGTQYYRRRVAVASEAIGDVVVLAAINERPTLDIVEMIETAITKGAIVIGRSEEQSIMNPALIALGRGAGFRVDARDTSTAAYPRTLLNLILAHPDRQLALRFPPSDSAVPVVWQPAQKRGDRSVREFGRRMGLIQRLLISSAPRVLTLVAVSSLLVVVFAIAYFIYALVVWLTLETVQQGWFTTSIVLAGTAAFLGSTTFGLSIGLQKIIELLTNEVSDDITDERSAVDMFGQVMHELNVDIEDQTVAPSSALPGAAP